MDKTVTDCSLFWHLSLFSFLLQNYRIVQRWAKRDAFSLEHFVQLSDVSSICANELAASNISISDSNPSMCFISECETPSSSSTNINSITNISSSTLHSSKEENVVEGNIYQESKY